MALVERVAAEKAVATEAYERLLHAQIIGVVLEEHLIARLVFEVARDAWLDSQSLLLTTDLIDVLIREVAEDARAAVLAEIEAERRGGASLVIERLWRGHKTRKSGLPLTPIGIHDRRIRQLETGTYRSPSAQRRSIIEASSDLAKLRERRTVRRSMHSLRTLAELEEHSPSKGSRRLSVAEKMTLANASASKKVDYRTCTHRREHE